MRVVGGMTALNASWPSAALILVEYKTDLQLGDELVHVSSKFM